MPDTFTTITNFINSPPGQVVAGGVLAGIVWKVFERVENVLTERTKLEIAVWLLGVRTTEKVQNWPTTFIQIFDSILGTELFSEAAFRTTSFVGIVAMTIATVPTLINVGLGRFPHSDRQHLTLFQQLVQTLLAMSFVVPMEFGAINIVPSYISFVKNRLLVGRMSRSSYPIVWIVYLGVDLLATVYLTGISTFAGIDFIQWLFRWLPGFVDQDPLFPPGVMLTLAFTMPLQFLYRFVSLANLCPILLYPALIPTFWLWLYAGSGFILKAARRFDIGFDWFNRKFDIEKKPLQSIGLVAGALVACLYWTAALIRHFV